MHCNGLQSSNAYLSHTSCQCSRGYNHQEYPTASKEELGQNCPDIFCYESQHELGLLDSEIEWSLHTY